MTTGVFARMLRRKPGGMWTQVPGVASTVSSPSVRLASPRRKCRTAGMEAVDAIKKGDANNNGAVTNPDRIVKMQVAADADKAKKN